MSCGAQIKARGCISSGEELLEVPAFLGSCQILQLQSQRWSLLTRPDPVAVTPPRDHPHPSPGFLSLQLAQKASTLHSLPLGLLRQSDCRLQRDHVVSKPASIVHPRSPGPSPPPPGTFKSDASLFLLGLKPFLLGLQYSCCDISKTYT